MIQEPPLDVGDIQGHVLPGFTGAHQRLVGLRFVELSQARLALLGFADQVTPLSVAHAKREAHRKAYAENPKHKRQSDDTVSLAMSLSAEALKLLRLDPMDTDDPLFCHGMHQDAESYRDPVDCDGTPTGWSVGGSPEQTPHVLVILASDSEDKLGKMLARILKKTEDCCDVIYDQPGSALKNGEEHFGFKDNISKLAVRGLVPSNEPYEPRLIIPDEPDDEGKPDLRHLYYARPGRPLVWPGNFVFGYETNGYDPLEPGKVFEVPDWLKNGSLLVLRHLQQDVPAFDAATKSLALHVGSHLGLTGHTRIDSLRALMVGRWKSGAPLVCFPKGGPDATTAAADRNRNNHFGYARPSESIKVKGRAHPVPRCEGDPLGTHCPVFAHIRKVNPRDATTDLHDPAITLSKLILRRSVLYNNGKDEHNNVDKGLLFLAYQTSIRDQFAFLVRNWMNSELAPNASGVDLLVGQSGRADNAKAFGLTNAKGKYKRFVLKGEWIKTLGGGYFLTPAISSLKRMLAVPEAPD